MRWSLWCAVAVSFLWTAAPAKAALILFDSRAQFDLIAPGLPIEDFEEGVLDFFVSFPDPLDATSNNAAFSPGDILPGLLLSTPEDFAGDDLFLAEPGFGSAVHTSKALYASFVADSLDLFFTDTTAVGLYLLTLNNPSLATIQVFGTGDVLLGEFGWGIFPVGHFFGVVNDAGLITRINLRSGLPGQLAPYDSIGVDDIAFGTPAVVPEPATLLLLGAGLAAAGYRRYRHRKP